MRFDKQKFQQIFPLIIFSSALYLIGCIIIFLLSEKSFLYGGLIKGFSSVLCSMSFSTFEEAFKQFCSLFLFEFKFIALAVCLAFCSYRHYAMIVLCSVKGFLSGFGCSLLLRFLENSVKTQPIIALCSIGYILCTIIGILALCFFSSNCLNFSKRFIFPLKIKILFKRKDTYSFVFEILCFIGIMISLTVVKLVTLMLTLL